MKSAIRNPNNQRTIMSTFKDDLTNDLDIFFDNTEFAVDVLYNAATIQCLFDNEFLLAVQEIVGVETTGPQALLKDSDIVGLRQKHEMTISGIVYKVTGIHPDGTGLTAVLLSQD